LRILLVTDASSIHSIRWYEALENLGHEIHIASFNRPMKEIAHFHRLSTFWASKFGYFLSIVVLKKLINEIKPDIVHAHHLTSYGLIAVASGFKPVIVTAWGSDVLIQPWKSILIRWNTRRVINSADAITIVAEHMRPSVIKLGGKEVKVKTIPFGVDLNTFFPQETIQKSSDIPIIISTRNFSPVYDIPTVITALSFLQERNIAFKAILTGDGPQRNEIYNLISKFKLGSLVEIKGHVSQIELSELLKKSQLFITSSLSDGNNISLNEAMATGCFPIASDIPANRQWIENLKNGLLFQVKNPIELANCIELALNNQILITKAFTINQKIVKLKANWHTNVNSMNDLYYSVINEIKK